MDIVVSDFSPYLETSVVVSIVISAIIFPDCLPLVNFGFRVSSPKILPDTYMHPFFKRKTEVILEVNITYIRAIKRFKARSQYRIIHDDVSDSVGIKM